MGKSLVSCFLTHSVDWLHNAIYELFCIYIYARINVGFNTAMCKIYKVKFCLLDDIYRYTGQSDVADIIVSRHRNFLYSAQHSHNVVVRNLATAML